MTRDQLVDQWAAKAKAARKTECAPEYQAYWRGYAEAFDEAAQVLFACDQSQSARIAELEGENADLIHDLERQMTIANIECNLAESARDALRQCARLARMETSSLATAIVETVNASLTKDSTSG